MKLIKERTILISNKSFMDFSEEIFDKLLVEYRNTPVEARAAVANLTAEITGEFYKRLFDINLDDDIMMEGGNR